jgi:hypothetical protein
MRTLLQRLSSYNAGIDPIVVYLNIKRDIHSVAKPFTVHTLKDLDFDVMIQPYTLDARMMTIAKTAWTELYYKFYRTRQLTELL